MESSKNLRGILNCIEENKVIVSIWNKDEEIIGTMDLSKFPQEYQKVGQVFDYNPSTGDVTITPPRILSDEEIEEMRKDLEARIPVSEYMD